LAAACTEDLVSDIPPELAIVASVGALFIGMVWSFAMMRKGSARAKNLLVEEAETEGTAAWKLFEHIVQRVIEATVGKLRAFRDELLREVKVQLALVPTASVIAEKVKAQIPPMPVVPTAAEIVAQVVEALSADNSPVRSIIDGAWDKAAGEIEKRVQALEDAVPGLVVDGYNRIQKGRELTEGRKNAADERSLAKLEEVAALTRLQQDHPEQFALYTKTVSTIKALGRLKNWTPKEIRDQIQALDDIVEVGADLNEVAKEWGIKTGIGGVGSGGYSPGV
jgi:hypothetical protein